MPGNKIAALEGAISDQREIIASLERRIKALEARPVFYPAYPAPPAYPGYYPNPHPRGYEIWCGTNSTDIIPK